MTDLRLATVIGSVMRPDVHVRSGPGIDFDVLFKAVKGLNNLTVLETRDDCQRLAIDGHLMQWHRLKFVDGREGWIREDLLSVNAQRPQGAAGSITIVAPPVHVAPASDPTRIVTAGEVNVRSAPTTEATKLGVLASGSEAVIIGVQADRYGAIDATTGLVFRWYSLRIGGYVREDVVRRVGDWSQFGLSAQPAPVLPRPIEGLWPSPVIVPYSFTNGFNLDPKHYHRGWDFATEGFPAIYSAPVSGTVVKRVDCAKCGPEGKSSYPEYQLNDRRIWNDPDWGYGFGHHLIIEFLHDVLPQRTKDFLALKGWQGWNAYCLYGHLSKIHVSPWQILTPSQEIGRMGNSGNSSDDHLHLELKFGPDFRHGFAGNERGLSDPGLLFTR